MLLFGDIVLIIFSVIQSIRHRDWFIFACFLFCILVLALGNSLCFIVPFVIFSQLTRQNLSAPVSLIFFTVTYIILYLLSYILETYWIILIISLILLVLWCGWSICNKKDCKDVVSNLYLANLTLLFISVVFENVLLFTTNNILLTSKPALLLIEKTEWRVLIMLSIYSLLFFFLDWVLVIKIIRPYSTHFLITVGILLIVTIVNIIPFVDNLQVIYFLSGWYSTVLYMHEKIIQLEEIIKNSEASEQVTLIKDEKTMMLPNNKQHEAILREIDEFEIIEDEQAVKLVEK